MKVTEIKKRDEKEYFLKFWIEFNVTLLELDSVDVEKNFWFLTILILE